MPCISWSWPHSLMFRNASATHVSQNKIYNAGIVCVPNIAKLALPSPEQLMSDVLSNLLYVHSEGLLFQLPL